jgi:hypothetical protein
LSSFETPSLLSSEAGVGGAGVTGVVGATLTGDLGPLLVTGVDGAWVGVGVGGVTGVVGVVMGGVAVWLMGGVGTGSGAALGGVITDAGGCVGGVVTVAVGVALAEDKPSSLEIVLLLPLRRLSTLLLTLHNQLLVQ